jgi:ribosomal protein S18 acetylase RimI-like enzyme
MVTEVFEAVKIRAARDQDLDAIIALDQKILGEARPEYWRRKMEFYENHSPMAPLVAEVEDKLVGFAMGDTSGWEFGIPTSTGWIDFLGVNPDYQRKGIGKALMKEMITNLRKVGVDTIYVLINWKNWDMLKLLDKMKFSRGDMINLELRV